MAIWSRGVAVGDVWQETTNGSVEVLVTLGRIEENQRHMTENLNRSEAASVGFQQSARDQFSEHARTLVEHGNELTRLGGSVKGLHASVGEIKDSMRASFTKSTVIVGLILTAVNVVFGVFRG